MSNRRSFAARAALAVGLMAGFYGLAVGLVLLLVGFVYAEIAYAHRLNLTITVGCGLAAYGILRSVFFVGDAFEPPGPEIHEADQPDLVGAVRAVAAELGADMPRHIYAIPDVNAFVADVGGWMGIVGTVRVMAVGVGLLNVDSVAQMKATVAHEFGHYHGGDTRLGGFLYRTRASLGRALAHLGNSQSLIMLAAAKPFEWYGMLFLSLTLNVSRAQELSADAFSVRIAGRRAHVDGLRREAAAGALYMAFLNGELGPVVEAGFAPSNLYEGFRVFLANLDEDGVLENVTTAINETKTDRHDTHPSLADRIAFAETLADPGIPDEPALARCLLANPDELERTITADVLERALGSRRATLREASWDEALASVVASRMDETSAALDAALGTRDDGGVASLFQAVREADRHAFARRVAPDVFRVGGAPVDELVDEVYRRLAISQVGRALVTSRGYAWASQPGRHLRLRSASGEIVDLAASIGDRVDEASLSEVLGALGLAADAGA